MNKGNISNKLIGLSIGLIALLIVVLIFVVWLNKPVSKIYEFKQADDYITGIENGDDYQLKDNIKLSDCNDYGCYEASFDYYRHVPINECTSCPDETVYVVIMTFKVEPNSEKESIRVENLSFYSSLSENRNSVELIVPQYKDEEVVKLTKTQPQIEYEPEISFEQDTYRGNFKFYNNVGKNETVRAYIAMSYPNSEEVFESSINLKIDFRDTESNHVESVNVTGAMFLENQ